MLSPRVGGGGAGYPREIDSASFSLGGDFDSRVLPWGWEFDIATTCFGQKAVPRGGNLTFSRCPGVGNSTLALVKMSNSPESARPSPSWGLTLISDLIKSMITDRTGRYEVILPINHKFYPFR